MGKILKFPCGIVPPVSYKTYRYSTECAGIAKQYMLAKALFKMYNIKSTIRSRGMGPQNPDPCFQNLISDKVMSPLLALFLIANTHNIKVTYFSVEEDWLCMHNKTTFLCELFSSVIQLILPIACPRGAVTIHHETTHSPSLRLLPPMEVVKNVLASPALTRMTWLANTR